MLVSTVTGSRECFVSGDGCGVGGGPGGGERAISDGYAYVVP